MKSPGSTNFILLIFINFILASSFINIQDSKKKKKEKKIIDPSELYSMGSVTAMSADSIPLGAYVSLTKEIINRKENKITMKSITIDQKGETVEYNYLMDITDPTFLISDMDNNFKGYGKLHGKKWKWTNWSYTINFQNPVGRMEAYNYYSLVGLVVNKAFYDPNGKILIRYKERHKEITKEQFEILYLQVLKCSTK